uniref:Uncharacterized protein n=1 Tax=Anguilla anguilla TaxID=7936 RepID=A0A0E9X1D3_ANGAN
MESALPLKYLISKHNLSCAIHEMRSMTLLSSVFINTKITHLYKRCKKGRHINTNLPMTSRVKRCLLRKNVV